MVENTEDVRQEIAHLLEIYLLGKILPEAIVERNMDSEFEEVFLEL